MKQLILFILIIFGGPAAIAATVENAPAELLQWKDWVLRGHPDVDCPHIAGSGNNRRCAWPGTLELDVYQGGADFTQRWDVYGKETIPLPGDQQHWPDEVNNNSRSAAVIERNNQPAVQVESGQHRITGKFNWEDRPQYLQVPAETAILSLRIDGNEVTWPNLDVNGRLWFKSQTTVQPGGERGDSVQVQVFRRINDNVPVTVDTELRLLVSGNPRELVMGRLLLSGSEPVQFDSALPARIEDDGHLRVQVRPGNWVLTMTARFTDNVSRLSMEKLSKDWPEQELWSFVHNPLLRGVKISGADAIDPSQLDLPAGWGELPTFLLNPGTVFTIEEQYRGDVSPTTNQISTVRTVWLDFDGDGATVKDLLSGTMNQGWRLSVQPAVHLGRITIDGVPELVTRLEETGAAGVEIRNSNLNVEAISRLDDVTELSATGWQHDIDGLQVELNLPPGWRLWHAGGPDSVQHSWLSSWDLWDLFLCLLIIGSVSKLFNWRWGVLAAVTFALIYHEVNAPLWTWVVLILVLPLIKVLPVGRFRQSVINLGYLTLAVLTLIIIQFAVQQIQQALYPQLEQGRAINLPQGRYAPLPSAARVSAPEEMADIAMMAEKKIQTLESAVITGQKKEPRYQPTANIQTGPGEPTWQWHRAVLGWNGPVKADAALSIYLSPPWLTRLLKLIEVLLTGLLAFAFARELFRNTRSAARQQGLQGTGTVTACLVLAIAAALVQPVPVRAQEFPPEYLLKELEGHLTRPPECMPDCYAVNEALITVIDNTLQIRLRIGVVTDLAIPLPADETWQPRQVALDGMKGQSLSRSGGRLWVRAPEGNHEVTMEAHISGDSINIPFAQNPHNISVSAEGWEIFGLVNNRVPSRSLQLQKQQKEKVQDTLMPAPIAPFVRVTRHVTMDLDWNVITTVTRIAPQQGGITVNIPLLKDESVVNENIKVIEIDSHPMVVANLAVRQQTVSWNSIIPPGTALEFTAPASPMFVEEWSVESSPRWHTRFEGLLPVKAGNNESAAIPRWLPWPGEQVTVHAVKPEPVPGPTVTVENIQVNTNPGTRNMDVEMSLSIRSSLGSEFRIQQPEGAELNKVVIDGSETTKQLEEDTVIIPVHPGLQTAVLTWSLSTGIAFRTTTPEFTLSAPANNIDLSLSIPPSRWPLLVTGPDIGPAMLYWGILVVILFIAAILGRINKQYALSIPVNTWQWILLAIGMSTVNMVGSVPVVLWFFLLEARSRFKMPQVKWKFNLIQVLLWLLSLTALACLFATIPESLLSTPDMKVTGNESYNYLYKWYQDNSGEQLPVGNVFSVSIWVYRIAMLAWSLWIVFALIRWSRWAWACISKDGLWKGKVSVQS